MYGLWRKNTFYFFGIVRWIWWEDETLRFVDLRFWCFDAILTIRCGMLIFKRWNRTEKDTLMSVNNVRCGSVLRKSNWLWEWGGEKKWAHRAAHRCAGVCESILIYLRTYVCTSIRMYCLANGQVHIKWLPMKERDFDSIRKKEVLSFGYTWIGCLWNLSIWR